MLLRLIARRPKPLIIRFRSRSLTEAVLLGGFVIAAGIEINIALLAVMSVK